MRLKVLWPGRTKNAAIRELEALYLRRIESIQPCEIITTETARGLDEKETQKILEIEAKGLEKRLKDDYIVCLIDRGREMNSAEFADFLSARAASGVRTLSFIVGGFLGFSDRLVARADLGLSLSSLTLMKGRSYAK
jgi:23S rRNA (pseudouridine1915-N3)-methyltransferase